MKNKEAKREYTKKYREKNKEAIREQVKEYKKKNREAIREQAKEYYEKNKEAVREQVKEYKKKNREAIREYARYSYRNNVQFKMGTLLRSRFNNLIRKQNVNKTHSVLELTGCDLKFLIKHIEDQFKEGMSWDNWSYDGWHVDHIIPLSSFDLTDIEEQKKAFHYTNLQPLWAKENLSKGCKVIWEYERNQHAF